MFDVDALLENTTTESNETSFTPIPEGEYTATISSVKARSPKEGMALLDIVYDIDDPDLAQRLNRQKVTVRQSVFLDIENGKLATGPNQNVDLGRVREAVGQNQAGKPWAPSMLEGAGPVRIIVGHRQDKNDPAKVYDDVKKVARA